MSLQNAGNRSALKCMDYNSLRTFPIFKLAAVSISERKKTEWKRREKGEDGGGEKEKMHSTEGKRREKENDGGEEKKD